MNKLVSKLTTILIVTINGIVSTKTINNLKNNYRIIIIENNNSRKLEKKFSKGSKNIDIYIQNKNLGFGGGNNIGLKKVVTPYVLMLNPDVEISKKSVEKFENYSKKISNFSILTANVKDFDLMMNSSLDKILKYKKFKFRNLDYQSIPWVPEWCMYCKVADLKKVNFFDESYFLYYEGLDLCKKLIKYNKRFYVIKDIHIIHAMAGTSKKLKNKKFLQHWQLRFWHLYWSSFFYHRKHYGYITSFKIHITKLIRFFFKKSFLYFFNKKDYNYLTTKSKFEGILNQILNRKSFFRIKL